MMRFPCWRPTRRAVWSLPVVVSILLAFAAPAAAQTILNVEREQPSDVEGWHWGVGGSASLARGNTENVDIDAGVVVGYRWTGDWLRLFGGLDFRPLTESVRLIGVSYIQPDFSDFGDLRALVDLSLRISLTENLDLTVQNEWRHDSRPPGDVEPNDYVLRTGFSVSFR